MDNATETLATLALLVKSESRVEMGFTAYPQGDSDKTDVMSASEGIAFVTTMEMLKPLKGWDSIRYTVYRNEDALGVL